MKVYENNSYNDRYRVWYVHDDIGFRLGVARYYIKEDRLTFSANIAMMHLRERAKDMIRSVLADEVLLEEE